MIDCEEVLDVCDLFGFVMIDSEKVLDVCDLFDFVHKSINKISGPLFLVFNETSDSLCIFF